MPSVFRCNIDQYIRYDPLTGINHSNASNSYTCDPFSDTKDTDRSQAEWIQTYDVETHTNQLLIEHINDLNTDYQETPEVIQSANIVEPTSLLLQQHEVIDPAVVNSSTLDNEYETATDDMGDCMYLNKTEPFDYMEPLCLINTYGVEEKADRHVSDSEDCATLVDIIQDECLADSTRSNEKLNGTYDVTCRLCAKTFESDIGLINIFSEDSERLMVSINSIMPNTVSDFDVTISLEF